MRPPSFLQESEQRFVARDDLFHNGMELVATVFVWWGAPRPLSSPALQKVSG